MDMQTSLMLVVWSPLIVFNFIMLIAIRNDIKKVIKKFIDFEREFIAKLAK